MINNDVSFIKSLPLFSFFPHFNVEFLYYLKGYLFRRVF